MIASCNISDSNMNLSQVFSEKENNRRNTSWLRCILIIEESKTSKHESKNHSNHYFNYS